MGTKERQAIDIKLIELVKKNAVLYDERRYRGHHLAERTKIWDKIGAEMNQHFNVQRGKCSISLNPPFFEIMLLISCE